MPCDNGRVAGREVGLCFDRWQVTVGDRCWLSRLAAKPVGAARAVECQKGLLGVLCGLLHPTPLCWSWLCSLPWHGCRWLMLKADLFWQAANSGTAL